MARKKDDKTQTAAGQAAGKPAAPESKPAVAPGEADQAAPPPGAKPLLAVASGEPPAENAEAVYVKTRTAERFYRCGLAFGRLWRLVERQDLSEPDWQRLLAEPHLEVQGVALVAEEHAA